MITTVTTNVAIDKTYIVDNFSLNGVFRVKQVLAQAGGKGLNVARVIHNLGEEVIATGFIGGYTGSYIKEIMAREGMKEDFVVIEGESRICINILDPVGKTQTELLEPGPDVSQTDAQKLVDKVKELASSSKVVTISGSLTRGLAPGFYSLLIEVINQAGAMAILDTSGAAFIEGIKARPYMVKPNQQEAETLAGHPLKEVDDQKKFLMKLLESGVQVAVLSLGGDGALVATENDFFKVIPPRVQAINTVGCGDAFVAGFAVGLARGEGVTGAARLATAAASASATRWQTGQCQVELVNKLLDEVRLLELHN
ncbi:tagatose-6-phosphate kinase [Moorella thermoacetica]|uniref:Tagatose-6-phosphate kinase n=1 Tax=Moorella thermoacetica (strain ATCC 39073 / JCM 9320) TaxID=264732 RepID=Q2RKU8_MOOTA|nr:1-phosphofructokinase [Moorella thermoacetica]AKX93367.1 tagatose-6-phosphate kinase [Moorella thermoacetica]AKX96009.1 tagatose-6-phosphate kinase [Moorella thermoacetica]OIQ56095.1 tagatose-6-phosphate kinase [Moorella thermoacetica]QCZ99819.1 Tagatose-6-phosphate kinase [Moorella thermoacetica]TYL08277.1 Tagatose-6-phosphate kinase [Moorella thermoacetica]